MFVDGQVEGFDVFQDLCGSCHVPLLAVGIEEQGEGALWEGEEGGGGDGEGGEGRGGRGGRGGEEEKREEEEGGGEERKEEEKERGGEEMHIF